MKKEEAIKRINQMGHAGQIVALITRIGLIIGIAALLIGVIVIALLPKGFLTVEADGVATVEIDMGKIGYTISEQERADIERAMENGSYTMKINGFEVVEFGDDYKPTEVVGNTIRLTGTGEGEVFDLHSMVWPLCILLVTLVLALVSCIFAGSLCKEFRNCSSPFEEGIIVKMRNLAFSLFPWTLLSSGTETMAWDMANFKQFEFHVELNLGMLFIALIVLALSYVFRYGAVLQQESDETL